MTNYHSIILTKLSISNFRNISERDRSLWTIEINIYKYYGIQHF